MSEEKLDEFLRTGKDWGRLATSVPGIYIQKLPANKSSPSKLVVEINPVNEVGAPTKRRGMIIRYEDEYTSLKAIINNEKLPKLLKMLDGVNPGGGSRASKNDDVIII